MSITKNTIAGARTAGRGTRSISFLGRTSLRAGVAAVALASGATFAGVARAESPPFNPIGAQSALVVPIDVRLPSGSTDWVKDCILAKPGDKTFAADFAWAKTDWLSLWHAPRHSAPELQGLLNSGSIPIDLDYRKTSYSKTSWSFTVLDNPHTLSGWWPSPHDEHAYCKNVIDRLTAGNSGLFLGDGAIVRDAVETVIPQAIALGLLTPKQAASYHRIVVVNTYEEHGGQTRKRIAYNVNYGGGAVPATFSAALVTQGRDDPDFADQTEHELGHELGLDDYYGSCPYFAPSTNLDCVGVWDPMSNNTAREHFSSYSAVKLGWIPEGSDQIVDVKMPLLVSHPGAVTSTIALAPLEASLPKPKVLRIPFQPTAGGRFNGIWVECRQQIEDDRVPAEGIVVYRIDEQTGGRVIQTLRGVDPNNPNVPLSKPGDELVVPLGGSVYRHKLRITFNGFVRYGPKLSGAAPYGPPLRRCSVTASEEFLTVGKTTRPRFPFDPSTGRPPLPTHP
jgi:hypothetical protein